MKEKWFYCEQNIMAQWEVVCEQETPREINNPDTQENVNYFALNEDNKQDFIVMLLLDSMAKITDQEFVSEYLSVDIANVFAKLEEEEQEYILEMVECAKNSNGPYYWWLYPQNAEELLNELNKVLNEIGE